MKGLRGKSEIASLYENARSEGFHSVDRNYTAERLQKLEARAQGTRAAYYVRHPGRLVLDAAKGTLKATRAVGSVIESGPRIAEFMNDLEMQGWKPGAPLTRDMLVRASNAASKVTVAFKEGGATAKRWSQVYPYLNAATQGIRTYAGNWKKNPGRYAARTLAYSVGPKLALWGVWQKDEEHRAVYDRMPAWRRLFWNIPWREEDGTLGAIALPYVSLVDQPANLLIAALDAERGRSPGTPSKMLGDVAREWAPLPPGEGLHGALGAAVPGPLAGVYDVATGKRSFSGAAVNPKGSEGIEEIAPDEVAQDWNGLLVRQLAKALHELSGGASKMTAAEIAVLLENQFGGPSRYATRAAQEKQEARDIPVVGQMFPRIRESRHVERYYELRRASEGAKNLVRVRDKRGGEIGESLEEGAALQRLTRKLDDALSDLREEYAAADEAQRREIAEEMDELALTGIEELEPVVEAMKKTRGRVPSSR